MLRRRLDVRLRSAVSAATFLATRFLVLVIASGCGAPDPNDSATSSESVARQAVSVAVEPPVGTWTALPPNPVASSAISLILLTDGSVLANADSDWHLWSRLVPDQFGSYVNGTWTQVASSARGRLYYPEVILRDGRVWLAGGEFMQSTDGITNGTELYDPSANAWIAGPDGLISNDIGDSPAVTLNDGRVLVGARFGSATQLYDPATNAYTLAASVVPGTGSSSEAGWQLLADGTVFDFIRTPERYLPSTNQWIATAPAPVILSTIGEIGPYAYLQDGRVFCVGDHDATAFFTPPPTLTGLGSWTVGPSLPNGLFGSDTPAAMLPNGKFLLEGTDGNFGPLTLFEFDPSTNAYTTVPSPFSSSVIGFTTRMLVLPTGQILIAGGGAFFAYTPDGGPQSASQLNGNSYGAVYGDDAESSSNYPIVYLKNATGQVFFARTFDFSTLGLRTGTTPMSTRFVLPRGLPGGSYSLFVNAVGISSEPLAFTAPPSSVTTTANNVFFNTPFANQSGTFTAQFDASPSLSPTNSVVGLSNGPQTAYTGLAAIVRFNPSGNIDARNGGSYQAASVIPYSGGATYHFRLVVNVPAHTYSIFVTRPGQTETTVGLNFAFRTEQSTVSQLNSYAVDANSGTTTVSNFSVAPDFSLSVAPSTRTVNTGNTTTYTITASPVNGFNQAIRLSVGGLPPEATWAFSPNPIAGGSGSSTLTVTTIGATQLGTYPLTIIGQSGGGVLTHTASTSVSVQKQASTANVFINTAIKPQSGFFTVDFDASVSVTPTNSVIALANGAPTAFTGYATLVRFNPSGNIDARNGGSYQAASVIPYMAGRIYHFRLFIDVPSHTYSIFVTPPGQSELTVGNSFAFRTEQNGVFQLEHWGVETATPTTTVHAFSTQ